MHREQLRAGEPLEVLLQGEAGLRAGGINQGEPCHAALHAGLTASPRAPLARTGRPSTTRALLIRGSPPIPCSRLTSEGTGLSLVSGAVVRVKWVRRRVGGRGRQAGGPCVSGCRPAQEPSRHSQRSPSPASPRLPSPPQGGPCGKWQVWGPMGCCALGGSQASPACRATCLARTPGPLGRRSCKRWRRHGARPARRRSRPGRCVLFGGACVGADGTLCMLCRVPARLLLAWCRRACGRRSTRQPERRGLCTPPDTAYPATHGCPVAQVSRLRWQLRLVDVWSPRLQQCVLVLISRVYV